MGEARSAIELRRIDDSLVLTLRGSIDETLRDRAHEAMVRALEASGDVIVDAGEVDFIGSSGVGFLVGLRDVVDADGRRFHVRSPSPFARMVLDALSEHVEFEYTPDGEPGQPDPQR